MEKNDLEFEKSLYFKGQQYSKKDIPLQRLHFHYKKSKLSFDAQEDDHTPDSLSDDEQGIRGWNLFQNIQKEVENKSPEIFHEQIETLVQRNICNQKQHPQAAQESAISDQPAKALESQYMFEKVNQTDKKNQSVSEVNPKQFIEKERQQKNCEERIQQPTTQNIIQPFNTQQIIKFSSCLRSSTIGLQEENTAATQNEVYYKNRKLALSEPILCGTAQALFRLDNIKYCVGVGVGLKEILCNHCFDYKSNSNELGHGLYIVTSQGYSWSHSEKQEDDVFRESFNLLYPGSQVKISLQGETLLFKWKKGCFQLTIPQHIRNKYSLHFCAYLHAKDDQVSFVAIDPKGIVF